MSQTKQSGGFKIMDMLCAALLLFLTLAFHVQAVPPHHGQPFLVNIDNETAIIGNDYWNATIGRQYGTKLFYEGKDRVSDAVGHYVSYNGAQSDLNLTNARIFRQDNHYTDIVFTAKEGDFHWVLTPDLAGAYQYFVNRALPTLGEFRTLWRLDNSSFTQGKTRERDEALPALADILAANKTQDETWQRADGSYITKYDFSTFVPSVEGDVSYWGVCGEGVGSWYIHSGKDYLNGDHLKQELMVHRESASGDTVQLNMIHGTHYQAVSNDSFDVGRTWGPRLWYLNDGSASDAARRARQENKAWPYKWYKDDNGFTLRGSIAGSIVLSDGRPAAGAAIFLGDNHSNMSILDQGANYYYRTYADTSGRFSIHNVRASTYALSAWPNGGSIGKVSTVLSVNDVDVHAGRMTRLQSLRWQAQNREQIWQIGLIDRKATGFAYSGPPHQHARADNCPANLTFTVGSSMTGDWCFAQTKLGSWDVDFNLASMPANTSSALLTVSLAGFSSGSSANVLANGERIGNISALASDPSVYRSGTLAGEWHLLEFPINAGVLQQGSNTLTFNLTKSTALRGWIWDSVLLEWA